MQTSSRPRTHVIFETDLVDDVVDPELPGKHLSDFIQGELINKGFTVGCGMDCNYLHDFTVTVGNHTFHCMLGPVGGDMHLWMLQTESQGGWIPKMLKGDDTAQMNRLVVEIDRILKGSHYFKQPRWYKSADHYRKFGGSDFTFAP